MEEREALYIGVIGCNNICFLSRRQCLFHPSTSASVHPAAKRECFRPNIIPSDHRNFSKFVLWLLIFRSVRIIDYCAR